MAVEEKDVLRLMIAYAAFIAGSKRRQLGFDESLKKMMLHASASDTIAMEWSDDSLQVLLAGVQDVAGVKTFIDGFNVGTDSLTDGLAVTDEGIAGYLVKVKNDTGKVLTFETDSGDIIFKPANTEMFRLGPSNGFEMKNDIKMTLVPSTTGDAPLNIPPGTAPTSASNGDIYSTSTGFFMVANGGKRMQRATGTGSPEGVITGNIGDIYTDSAGGAGTTLYVKESGTGDTGWIAK